MKKFSDAVNNLFLREKGFGIDGLDYMDMPKKREKYNLSRTIGNVNLVAKRFKTKSEADVIIERFLSIPLP